MFIFAKYFSKRHRHWANTSTIELFERTLFFEIQESCREYMQKIMISEALFFGSILLINCFVFYAYRRYSSHVTTVFKESGTTRNTKTYINRLWE